ncbi:polysaccharide deacetylase family protein [Desulfovibrio desulfuricans]|uniref:Polysaccharide deacetylase family protein n=1 Tax=Desulfovibrio desulfuricans TaxID=876 RepID=A0A4P7UK02_DESDE|nr:polysaccharide deacetylase family protein [Desulfovibrio desulfuricans]QCC86835.1 polysaccharide deacetylase family protein [Desulfovibrio desulfuricans]
MRVFFRRIWLAAFCLAVGVAALPAQARVVEGNVIMDQPMRENLCALTFDDGPSINTPHLLDMLEEYGIPATFFMLGNQAERHPDIVRRVLAEGHEVGNHSYSHPNLRVVSPARKEDELRRTDTILRNLGATPTFIRPPYGSYDASTEKIAEGLGLTVILWSMDSRDWQRLPDNYATLRNNRGTVYAPGTLRGIFLFHDSHKRTVDDLPRIIRDLRAGGCQRFVTVSDYLAGLMDPEPGLLMTRIKRGGPGAEEPSMVARHQVEGVHQSEELPPHSFPAGSSEIPLARSSTPWQLNEAPAADMGGQAALPGATAQPEQERARPVSNGAAQSRDGSALPAPQTPAS